jgi:hypothetical protein
MERIVLIEVHIFGAAYSQKARADSGTIENAQAIAAHESPRTSKLDNRTSDENTLDEVGRIAI